MKTLPEILEDIAQRGTVFLVHMGNATDAGSIISAWSVRQTRSCLPSERRICLGKYSG
jgi:hypothetical protein